MAITGMVVGMVNGYHYGTNSAQKAALSLAANARALERIEETRSAVWEKAKYPVVDQLVTASFPSKVVTLDLSGSGDSHIPATIQTEISPIPINPPLERIGVACIWQLREGQWVPNTVEACRAPNQ